MIFPIPDFVIITFTALLTFLFFIQSIHEIGHYITAKIYGYGPCAVIFNLCVFPGATLFLTDVRNTNTLHKLAGLFSPILLSVPFGFLLKVSGFPFYGSWLYWGWYFVLSFLSAGDDVRLVLEDYFEEEMAIPLLDRVRKLDASVYSCVLVTSKENWNKWKEKYPTIYRNGVDKETILPWA